MLIPYTFKLIGLFYLLLYSCSGMKLRARNELFTVTL
ncbi:hypothetical protein HCH_05256 [Hahella chejuensis KCTC 2396]|uniref:Uncharacterized protein n=1 Tax=Hahella chejuensis (strain KCTC 2396) TaxID=349521 RepID=Q2SBP3_HAHCH|nr:hypothetical protein HCH_05256 [Hahella chejuensis KCTC 2396]